MKNLFKKFVAFLTSSVCMLTFIGLSQHQDVKVANAATTITSPYTYDYTSKDINQFILNLNGTASLNGVEWNYDSTEKMMDNIQEKALQFNKKSTKTVFSTNAFLNYKIDSVELGTFITSNSANVTLSVSNNGVKLSQDEKLTTTRSVKILNSNNAPMGGNLVIEWTNNASKAYYLNSIKVNFSSATVKYTVTFNSNGGTDIAPITDITPGTTIKEPNPPTKLGYEFLGWELNGTPFNFSQAINESITLDAVWQQSTDPSISVNPDASTIAISEELTITSTFANAKEGAIVSWNIQNEGNNVIEQVGQPTNSNGASSIKIKANNPGMASVTASIETLNGTISAESVVEVVENNFDKINISGDKLLGLTFSSNNYVLEKVTSLDKLTDDEYIIAGYNAGTLKQGVLNGSQDGKEIKTALTLNDAGLDDNFGIVNKSNMTSALVKISKTKSGKYTIKTTLNHYIGTEKKGDISATANVVENKITFDEAGNAKISVQKGNSVFNLRYNDGANMFRYYEGFSMGDINLYKLVPSTVDNISSVRARLKVKIPVASLVEIYGANYKDTIKFGINLSIDGKFNELNDRELPLEKVIYGQTFVEYIVSVTNLKGQNLKTVFSAQPFVMVNEEKQRYNKSFTFSVESILSEYEAMEGFKDNKYIVAIRSELNKLGA